MKRCDYIAEVERQLHNSYYFEKLDSNLSEEVKSKIVNCVEELSEEISYISDLFDVFLFEIGYPGRPIVSACNSSTDNIC